MDLAAVMLVFLYSAQLFRKGASSFGSIRKSHFLCYYGDPFAQMASSMSFNDVWHGQPLDDIGLGMLFYRILSEMDDRELKVYTDQEGDAQFIQQLLDLIMSFRQPR